MVDPNRKNYYTYWWQRGSPELWAIVVTVVIGLVAFFTRGA